MDKKYEQLIEYILNDDTEKARGLFHDIVVNKSKEIYESLIDEVDLAAEDSMSDDMMGIEDDIDAEEIGEADDEMPSDDQTADMMGDVDADMGGDMDADMGGDMDADMGGEEELEDRVVDLEDALDELKREFEELMADESDEDESEDEDFDDESEDDMDAEEEPVADEEPEVQEDLQKTAKLAADFMREYIEKVAAPANTEGQGVADSGKVANVNTKSIVAGKNDMGGSTKNIARGGSNTAPDGQSAPSSDKADNLPHAGKFENVPGAKAGKTFSNAKKATSNEPSGVNKDSIIDGK